MTWLSQLDSAIKSSNLEETWQKNEFFVWLGWLMSQTKNLTESSHKMEWEQKPFHLGTWKSRQWEKKSPSLIWHPINQVEEDCGNKNGWVIRFPLLLPSFHPLGFYFSFPFIFLFVIIFYSSSPFVLAFSSFLVFLFLIILPCCCFFFLSFLSFYFLSLFFIIFYFFLFQDSFCIFL